MHSHARRNRAGGQRLPSSRNPQDANVLESPVQSACVKVLKLYGYKVYRVGQYNAARTQDEGPSDLQCFHPLDGIAFVECKRPVGAVWSKAQQDYAKAVVDAGGTYLIATDAKQLAEDLNRIRVERQKRQGSAFTRDGVIA